MIIDDAEVDKAIERLKRAHPLVYAIPTPSERITMSGSDLYELVHDDDIGPDHTERYNRCPVCEQWSPCDVRLLITTIDTLRGLVPHPSTLPRLFTGAARQIVIGPGQVPEPGLLITIGDNPNPHPRIEVPVTEKTDPKPTSDPTDEALAVLGAAIGEAVRGFTRVIRQFAADLDTAAQTAREVRQPPEPVRTMEELQERVARARLGETITVTQALYDEVRAPFLLNSKGNPIAIKPAEER